MSHNPRLVIGCPVSRREWIMGHWFDHVLTALSDLNIDFCFAFVIDKGDPSIEVIDAYCLSNGLHSYYVPYDPYLPSIREHNWTTEKVSFMVELRNQLLELVRDISPDYFFSLDSDILLHKDVLGNLIGALDKFDAVGGKVYLHRTTRLPSYANYKTRSKQLIRPDHNFLLPADVIMAAKLMTPQAYAIDYVFDRKGEDIGWSDACRDAGLVLGFDGRIASKHVMEQKQLLTLDKRVGY